MPVNQVPLTFNHINTAWLALIPKAVVDCQCTYIISINLENSLNNITAVVILFYYFQFDSFSGELVCYGNNVDKIALKVSTCKLVNTT